MHPVPVKCICEKHFPTGLFPQRIHSLVFDKDPSRYDASEKHSFKL